MRTALLLLLAAWAAGPDEVLDRRRDEICRRVEELRGSKFGEKVPIREGTRKEAGASALEQARELYGDDLAPFEKTAKALGLIPARLRLDLAIPTFAATKAQAFYAHGTVHVIDRGIPDDELVYRFSVALADRLADWKAHARAAGRSLDAQLAHVAVRQGSADMTKQLHWANLKADAKRPDPDHVKKLAAAADAAEREGSAWMEAVVPRFFVRSSDFGWRRGGLFMEWMRRDGRLDDAFKTPPRSTEQVLHPEKYLSGEEPLALDLAAFAAGLEPAGWTPLYQSTLGELGSAIWLEALGAAPDAAATAGWGGDRVCALQDAAGNVALAWASAWDSERDAEEFEAAARRAAKGLEEKRPGSAPVVRRRKSVTLLLAGVPAGRLAEAEEAAWRGTVSRDGIAVPLGGKIY